VHRVVADLGEAEHAFNLGHERWQFLLKLRMVLGGLDEVQQLFAHQISSALLSPKRCFIRCAASHCAIHPPIKFYS